MSPFNRTQRKEGKREQCERKRLWCEYVKERERGNERRSDEREEENK